MNALKKIIDKQNLSFEESSFLFEKLLSGEFSDVEIAAILTGLKLKGETIDEIAGAIMVLDEHKIKINKKRSPAIDTCGTGGDGKRCINVSTAVSLLLSSIGIPVVKHGNSAQSGKIGSADILKEFKIPFNLHKEDAEIFFEKNSFVFLFAPFYHPSMKIVTPIRKKLKIPTIFNFLGPFINPANPEFQVVGINRREMLMILSEAIKKAGKTNIVLYSSFDGYDEISTFAPTECYEVKEDYVKKFIIDPSKFFDKFPMPSVKNVEDAKEKFILAISGKDENLAKLIAINSMLPISYMKKINSLSDCFQIAYESIKNGKVLEKFYSLQRR